MSATTALRLKNPNQSQNIQQADKKHDLLCCLAEVLTHFFPFLAVNCQSLTFYSSNKSQQKPWKVKFYLLKQKSEKKKLVIVEITYCSFESKTKFYLKELNFEKVSVKGQQLNEILSKNFATFRELVGDFSDLQCPCAESDPWCDEPSSSAKVPDWWTERHHPQRQSHYGTNCPVPRPFWPPYWRVAAWFASFWEYETLLRPIPAIRKSSTPRRL